MSAIKTLSLISFLFIGFTAFSQTKDTTITNLPEAASNYPINAEDKIYEKVEMEAYFPGGDAGWIKFLQRNLDPQAPIKKNKRIKKGSYTVWIQFVVDKQGKISEITPLTKLGSGMEDEVIRILKISPKWIPAQQNGRPVRAYRKQPVTFMIE